MNRKAASADAHRRPGAATTQLLAISATAALALLAAACGGSPSSAGSGGSPTAGGPASSPSAVAFSGCMRAQGVPDFPDPGSSGALPKTSPQLLGVSSSQFDAAQRACQHLLPATGGSLTATSYQQCFLAGICPQALVQQALNAGRTFSRCMRSHGAPDWPDPTINSQGIPLYNITVPRPPPPHVGTAISECERLAPAGSLLAWG